MVQSAVLTPPCTTPAHAGLAALARAASKRRLRPLYGPATAAKYVRGVVIGSAADQLPPSMSYASTTSRGL